MVRLFFDLKIHGLIFFNLHLSQLTDNASQAEKFKDALRAIADLRNSKALRALADTGVRGAFFPPCLAKEVPARG